MPKTKIAVSNRQDPYITTNLRSPESDKFWRWGDDNLLPNHLSILSRQAVTHRRIINDKADYITGKGFSYDGTNALLSAFVERANGDGESLRQVLSCVAFDKMLFANAFVEVVRDAKRSTLALYHQDASRCRVAKDSQHILIHPDWMSFKMRDAKTLPIYPLFEMQADGTERSVIHYKDYEPMFTHYGVPSYIAGLNVSAIAYKTDRWNISRLDNSFQMSGVMMLDDAVSSEEEAEQIIRTAEKKFGGKPGQVLFVVKDGSESDNSRFIPLTSSSDGDWESLHTQANTDIVVAHSWFRSLSGIDYSSGFSSERILHEYEVALNTVILAEQEELMEPIRDLLREAMGSEGSTLSIINQPPTRTKPIYMRIWEARKIDGLEYDAEDPLQQQFLADITASTVTSIG
ncbi:MAG: phage portal protein [Rikenellaceae bacterium]